MSFFTFLDKLLIGPLKLLFEFIYIISYRVVNHPGLAIIALSLIMNILVLPLYRRADAMQEASRDIEAKLANGVSHIKKVFTGDERMMILQTYYRQNNYKPTDALNGSVSLLLEIPFFMAAYQFLSNAGELKDAAFGPIANLGAPDGLIVLGGITINALPILMTLINVISSAIYLKGFPLKTKIQLYGMALFFLVFLYTSPSGLVFYWTLNNLFSLVKTIFYKLKNPKKTGSILLFIAGVIVLSFGLLLYQPESVKRKLFVIGIGFLATIPLLLSFIPKRKLPSFKIASQANRSFFLLACLFMTLLTGFLIPSAYIAASPLEYINSNNFYNPLLYILHSTCIAAGFFLVWMQVFYWLASPGGKVIFDKVACILCGVMFVNYMFFGTNLGIISANLQFESKMVFSAREEIVNLLTIGVLSTVLAFASIKWPKPIKAVLLTAVLTIAGMSAINAATIHKSVSNYTDRIQPEDADMPHFQLSKSGQNVVVIMLDRALGGLPPYLFNERPELQEQFAGFTYYDNVVSFGQCTNLGAPSLFGGYEYTPVEMNKRSSEKLVDKHNEALKVLPVMFLNNGYDVTVCDPPYANYEWIPDLGIYSDYPEISTYITDGYFTTPEQVNTEINSRNRNFFCFGLMKTMPLCIQPTIYQGGRYNCSESLAALAGQTHLNMSQAEGLTTSFLSPFEALKHMCAMTEITDEPTNTYLSLVNYTTHEPTLLQAPDYIPNAIVDNTEYDAALTDRFTVNGSKININSSGSLSYIHINMAAFIQLGNWFDYLREHDVYDNTRIIIAADHGRGFNQFDELVSDPYDTTKDVSHYYPLLMMKDFNSSEYTTNSDFMTNADVPTLAVQGIIEDPTNPFTGLPINSDEKNAHPQFVSLSSIWEITVNNGNTFLPDTWASVKDDIWDKENWEFCDDSIVLSEHAFP